MEGKHEKEVQGGQVESTQIKSENEETKEEREPTYDHAKDFIKMIKTRFLDQPAIYKAFLDIIHEYHTSGETIKEVAEKVNALFVGHDDLIAGFKTFLPGKLSQPKLVTYLLTHKSLFSIFLQKTDASTCKENFLRSRNSLRDSKYSNLNQTKKHHHPDKLLSHSSLQWHAIIVIV
eukprot:Phypoly_transcript_11040.p1 GENE.Phypoly_transcript_11040~~Phypoly_transcript_11040.p1  ORF type:complete len:176 (+),score=31.28 Phypoly_transcript_11040:683-1210(+)